eukprot:EG_transcript_2193
MPARPPAAARLGLSALLLPLLLLLLHCLTAGPGSGWQQLSAAGDALFGAPRRPSPPLARLELHAVPSEAAGWPQGPLPPAQGTPQQTKAHAQKPQVDKSKEAVAQAQRPRAEDIARLRASWRGEAGGGREGQRQRKDSPIGKSAEAVTMALKVLRGFDSKAPSGWSPTREKVGRLLQRALYYLPNLTAREAFHTMNYMTKLHQDPGTATLRLSLAVSKVTGPLAARFAQEGDCRELNGYQASTLLRAFSQLEVRDADDAFVCLCNRMMGTPSLSDMDIAIAVHSLAKSRVAYTPFLRAMSGALLNEGRLQRLSAQGVANVVWGFATLGYREEPFMQAVATQLGRPEALGNFTVQGVANLVWAFAKLELHDAALMAAVATRVLAALPAMNAQDIANTAWAFAKLDARSEPLIRALAARVKEGGLLRTMTTQALVNTAWAFARMGAPDEALMTALAAHMMRPEVLRTMKAMDVSNAAWAFAKADFKDDALMEALAAHILDGGVLPTMEAQAVSNVVWAFATLDVRHVALMKELAVHIMLDDLLPTMKAQELSIIAWAYARLGMRSEKLMRLLAARIVDGRLLPTMTPQGVANIAWAFATEDVRDEALMKALGQHAVDSGILQSMNAQTRNTTEWAFAKLAIRHEALEAALASRETLPRRSAAVGDRTSSRLAGARTAARRLPATAEWATPALAAGRSLARRGQAWEGSVASVPLPEAVQALLWRVEQKGGPAPVVASSFRRLQHLQWWAFAAADAEEAGRLREDLRGLLAWAMEVGPDFPPKAAFNVLDSLAMLQQQPNFAALQLSAEASELATVLAAVFLEDAPCRDLSPHQARATIWALSALRVWDADGALVCLCRRMMEATGPQPVKAGDLAMAVYSLAKARVAFVPFLQYMSSVLLKRNLLPRLTSQRLANLAWGCATLNYRDEPLLRAVAARAVHPDLLPTFSAQGVANVLWAF